MRFGKGALQGTFAIERLDSDARDYTPCAPDTVRTGGHDRELEAEGLKTFLAAQR